MRVLSLSTLFPRPDKPGFGRFVARQFEALVAQGGIDLTVIAPFGRPLRCGPAELDQSRGYPVHYLPFPTVPKLGALWNARSIARAALPLVRKLHTEVPFDLVDAQFFFPDGPGAARIAVELGLPLSIKARGSDIHYWGHQRFADDQMRAAANQARGLLAVSEALRADMAALGIEPGKIAVHYTGLDHGLFRPRPRPEARQALAARVPTDGPLLVSVGNLIALKGHAVAIEALTHLSGTRLAIAGTGGEHANLAALAQRLGLTDRVHLLGSIDPAEIATLLCAADAFVLPSADEGLANAWIEALACGTPLVITDVGGAREVVTSPAAGRLVARNPEAIAVGVRELLQSPPSQAEVARHAARFSWEANAAQLAAHYSLVAG